MPILLLFVGRDGEAGSAFGLNDGLQPWQQGPPEVGEFHWSEDELRAAIRTQLEVAYIDGTGSSSKPLGLLRTSGTGSKTYAGTIPTYNELCDQIDILADANGDLSQARFLMHPSRWWRCSRPWWMPMVVKLLPSPKATVTGSAESER